MTPRAATRLVTIGVYARGDWKKKRLLDEEEVLTVRVSDEILSGEGSRPPINSAW